MNNHMKTLKFHLNATAVLDRFRLNTGQSTNH